MSKTGGFKTKYSSFILYTVLTESNIDEVVYISPYTTLRTDNVDTDSLIYFVLIMINIVFWECTLYTSLDPSLLCVPSPLRMSVISTETWNLDVAAFNKSGLMQLNHVF